MNDQPNPWEDDWRDELAGHQAPLQPGDWAAMNALLAAGLPAPPEPATPVEPTGPGATTTGSAAPNATTAVTGASAATGTTATAGLAATAKTLLAAAALVTAGTFGYWLADAAAPPAQAQMPPPTITIPADSLLPAADERTTSPRIDTVYYTDNAGNIYTRVDTAIINEKKARLPGTKTSVARQDITYQPGRNAELTDDIPQVDSLRVDTVMGGIIPFGEASTDGPSSPASPPLGVGGLTIPASTSPPNAPVRPNVAVFPIHTWPVTDLTSFDAWFRARARRTADDKMLPIRPAPTSNGYFPPVIDDNQ